MSLYSSRRYRGSFRKQAHSTSKAIARWRYLPLIIKLSVSGLLCLLSIIFSIVTLARTEIPPDILDPPKIFLPGNPIPQLAKDANCNRYDLHYVSCIIHSSSDSEDMYMVYELGTERIIHTGVRTHQYKIGQLILTWGFPTGIIQYDTTYYIYWGTRSAVLDTPSFRPESLVEYLQYDMDEHPAAKWQGFFCCKHH